MVLILVNQTGSTKTYLSGALSVPGNGSLSVTSTVQQLSLTSDGSLHSDINSGLMYVSDGTSNYASTDALNYLQILLKTLGPISDGIGNNITSASNGNAGNQLLHVQVPDTTTATVALGSLNATISISMTGLPGVGFQLAAGTLIGTITPQCSLDGGTSWVTCAFYNPISASSYANFSFATANPLTILSILPISGSSTVRVIVTNYVSGTANAVMRASAALGPVASASSLQDPQTFNYANVTQINELRNATSIRLRGANFIGTVLDTNMWSSTATGSGSYTQSAGIMTLSTGTTANSSEFLASINRARHVSGSITAVRISVRLNDTGVTNNIRRWGGYDSQDGVFFQLNNITPGIGVRNAGVDTIITSFNGPHPFLLDTNFHTYEMQYGWGAGTVYFYQDNNLIHTYVTLTTTISSNPNFHLGFETTNSGGGTSNESIHIRDAEIMRYGEADVKPRYFHPIFTARVQNTTGSTSGSASTLVIPINATKAGDLIVVTAASLASTLTITDSASQTYSTATTNTSTLTHLYTFYIANTAAGVTSITITPSVNDRVVAIVTEYSNVITSSPLDQTSTNNNTAVTSWTSNSTPSTTQAIELLVGSALDPLHNNDIFVAGSGWLATNTVNGVGGGNTLTAFQEDQYVTSTGTYAATGTNGTSSTILAAIATFKLNPNILSNGLTILNSPVVINIGAGTLRRFIINTPGTGSAMVTFYDNTTNSGNIIAIISLTSGQNELNYDLDYNIGLTMVINSATADFTVVYD